MSGMGRKAWRGRGGGRPFVRVRHPYAARARPGEPARRGEPVTDVNGSPRIPLTSNLDMVARSDAGGHRAGRGGPAPGPRPAGPYGSPQKPASWRRTATARGPGRALSARRPRPTGPYGSRRRPTPRRGPAGAAARLEAAAGPTCPRWQAPAGPGQAAWPSPVPAGGAPAEPDVRGARASRRLSRRFKAWT